VKQLRDTLVAWGPLGLLLLSMIESAGIPNPGGTDVLVLLLTIADPGDAVWCALAATIGSMIGSWILFRLARKGGEMYLKTRLSGRWGTSFREWFQRYGLLTVFVPSLVPLPFLPMKAFVVCAGALGVPASKFLLVMLAGRIPRYGGLAYLGAQLGDNSTDWLKSHVWHLAGIAGALFIVLYILIRITGRMRKAGGS
jgi:membrane protein DedA with SNARE-associated domain